jgi:hypothetical protein
MALCLVLLSPDSKVIPILLFGMVFYIASALAGALLHAMLWIVISLLKIGLLLITEAVISGLSINQCLPNSVKGEVGNWNNASTAPKPRINYGDYQEKLCFQS